MVYGTDQNIWYRKTRHRIEGLWLLPEVGFLLKGFWVPFKGLRGFFEKASGFPLKGFWVPFKSLLGSLERASGFLSKGFWAPFKGLLGSF